MLIKIRIDAFDGADDMYLYGKIKEALELLSEKLNRKDFTVCSGTIYDDVGYDKGKYIDISCDDMFKDIVMKTIDSAKILRDLGY